MIKFSIPKLIGVCAVFLALPFFINFLSCIEAPFKIWEQPSEWTKFWGQYISGFVAFVMLYIAWKSLYETKEANKPYIVIDIVDRGNSRVFIRCRNIGKTTASNIKITIEDSIFGQIKIDKVRESIASINNTRPFFLEPNGEKVWEIFLIPGTHLDAFHGVWGENAKYPFKGEYILKSEWVENENLFKSRTLNCQVTYNNEYYDSFEVDYNNILDGISPDKRISDSIFSVMVTLSHIDNKLDNVIKAINGTEQDK